MILQQLFEASPGGSDNYAENLAQKVFNVRPNLRSEDDVLNIGHKVATQDLMSQVRANYLFARDQDFPSDFVSAYYHLQKQGVAEAGPYGSRSPDTMSANDYDRYQQDQMDYGKRDFKRREHEAEWEQEKAYSAKLAAQQAGPWYIRLNGKLLRDKTGNPYTFNSKAAANKAALTMQAKLFNQGKEFMLTTNPNDKPQGVAEGKGPLGQGDLALALDSLKGGWSGWHKDEDMSSPDIEVYDYDDGEGNYYGSGTIEHNLKTGEIKVEYHDSESDVDVDDTFHSVGDAMKALRGQWGQSHGGKAPNFDRLGQRKQHGPDDLRKTDRTGRKGTLAGGPSNELKRSIQWSKGKHGPQGVLPEQGVAEDKPRFDPLVAKIAAKMKGPTENDAIAALITVLGTSAYNERPGFYSLWLRQAIDKYSQQGVAEEKVRLDPKCWTGKKIGDPKTKVKGGVRVNNCVPAESVEEAANPAQQAAIAIAMKKAGKKPKNVNEFAPVGGDDREPNEEEILRQLAAQWWLGTEQQMAKAQSTLAAMGWEIGQDESGDDDAGVFVIRAGDENGDSYLAFNHSDLDLNEATDLAESKISYKPKHRRL